MSDFDLVLAGTLVLPDELAFSVNAMVRDGTDAADRRLSLSLTNDTSIGVIRYADAGYDEARDEAGKKHVGWLGL